MLSSKEILGPGGRIAARLPNYEHRSQQLDMAEAVDRAIRGQHHLVVEAGTGVGKSFAYLVPAILAAAGRQESDDAAFPPRGRFHPYDQSSRAVDREGSAAAAQRHSAGVLGRAGQGAGQLRQPAAVGKRHGPRGQPVPRPRGVRATPPASRLVEGDRPTARCRTWISARCRRCGTRWRAITATAWAARARCTAGVSITRPGGGCKTPRFWWSTTPCFSPTWRCAASRSAFCRNTTWRFSTKPTRSKPWPATTWVSASPTARSSTPCAGSTTSGPIAGCWCITTCARPKKTCGNAVTGRPTSSRAWRPGWPTEPKGNGRVRRPGIVANPLGEGLRKLVATLRHEAKQIDEPEQRQDFTAAANRLEAIAQGIDDWLGQQSGRLGLLDRPGLQPQPLADHAGRGADRRGTDPPRAPVRPGADRDHDQRHAGHRRPAVPRSSFSSRGSG